MTRSVSVSRISIAAAALLLIAACSSDAGETQETFDGELVGSGSVLETLSEEELAARLEAERAVEESLGGSVYEVVEPTPTSTVSPRSESGVVPEGFSTVMVEITKADGEVCEVCMWLADSAAERGQGLMGVTSLGTPEGMAFVWEQPTSGAFFMFQTVTPLSIAWFGAAGDLVSTADMDPCLSDNAAACDRYSSGGEFVLAIEVFQGDLASIGISDGATARLLPDTEATDCPLR